MYKNTHLKQERGMQVEAIRAEVFAAFAGSQDGESSDLMATAIGAAAASLGGLGGLGDSTSNPSKTPDADDGDAVEEGSSDMPSVAPPDENEVRQSSGATEEEAGFSGRVLPMGSTAATPAQVSRALKVRCCCLLY